MGTSGESKKQPDGLDENSKSDPLSKSNEDEQETISEMDESQTQTINNNQQQHSQEPTPTESIANPDSDPPPTKVDLSEDRIIKHIMVIGFHHKHGYQVDYCYPPLEPNGPTFSTPTNPICLPDLWKTLPLLCLPDGSHNYDSDTIYFTMPDRQQPNNQFQYDQSNNSSAPHQQQQSSQQEKQQPDKEHEEQVDTDLMSKPPTNKSFPIASQSNSYNQEPTSLTSNKNKKTEHLDGIKTIFGTACYRQIQADKLLNRTDDMTRFAVQKSVCILSSKPLFGLIRSKLEMITHAYFEELDFSKVSILKLTYDNLNSLLSRDSVKENAIFLGLSARQLISQFGYNTLVLYKAILLEKKILFYKSPVRDLCSTILSICSLFTGLLESGGLDYSTCDLQLSASLLEALKLLPQNPSFDSICCDHPNHPPKPPQREERVLFSPAKEQVVIISGCSSSLPDYQSNLDEVDKSDEAIKLCSPTLIPDTNQNQTTDETKTTSTNDPNDDGPRISNRSDEFVVINDEDVFAHDNDHPDPSLVDSSLGDDQHAFKLCRIMPEDCGLPLQIFTRGSFCLPYLSITYLDLLSDSRVKSFVIGATNFLFKQKRDMYDVIVDMEENNIIINDMNLKRCLTLTTEDLRFMDNLCKHVKSDTSNLFGMNEFDLISQDITRWVGGDEWIRYHFRIYTLYLLKISRSPIGWELFNSYFVQAWKQTTNNYKIWESTGKQSLIDGLQCRHPSSSGSNKAPLNFNDMKLKLSYAVNASEKGRMINQTLNGIGKWSIWNNIASAAGAAATTAAATISSASTQIVNNAKATNIPHLASRLAPQSSQNSQENSNSIPGSSSSSIETQQQQSDSLYSTVEIDDNII